MYSPKLLIIRFIKNVCIRQIVYNEFSLNHALLPPTGCMDVRNPILKILVFQHCHILSADCSPDKNPECLVAPSGLHY